MGLGSELCRLRAASCPHVMWIKTVFSRIRGLNVSQFMKMFPLGGTCSWTCKALGLTGDSFLLGWVHQLMSVDGIARREARELCKWRPSQLTEHFFPQLISSDADGAIQRAGRFRVENGSTDEVRTPPVPALSPSSQLS